MRTYIYIDGFNFYYGAVKNTPYKWLDFKSLFTKLLSPANKIVSIKYFTAIVTGKIDPNQPQRQKTYLRALRKHIPEYRDFYARKYAEATKHKHKRALVLTARKSVGLIVGLLHRNEPYRSKEARQT